MKKYQKLSKKDLTNYPVLNDDNYFLAVCDGSNLGVGSVQVYLDKNDFSVCIAHLVTLKTQAQINHSFYLCDEYTYRVVCQADDIGRTDDDFAFDDSRGRAFAFDAFSNLLNLSKGL